MNLNHLEPASPRSAFWRSCAAYFGGFFFNTAVIVAILVGVRAAFVALIPADSCAATPVNPIVYILCMSLAFQRAFESSRSGVWPMLRLGVTMLAGVSLAVLAARLAAGCTPAGGWTGDYRSIVEALVLFSILIPLAELHLRVIEPRWKSHG